MAKYTELVNDILKNIGGKDNIISVTHCVTRLRFNLKDESIAHDDVLKNMDGVVTVMKTAGQYQVVIGNHVPDVYAELLKQAGISGEMDASVAPKKMPLKDRAVDIISGIMMPSMAILCASGMIKGFLSLFMVFGLINPEGSWYLMFEAIGDTMFYFFPVILGFNAAKKFGANPYLGMMIGAAIMYPTLQNVDLVFFGKTINASYTSSVLPVIFIVALAAPLEKLLNKVIPDVIKTFVVPMLVMVVIIPVGFMVIGPAANFIGYILATVVAAIYGFSPMIAGAFLGFFWQIIVMFGVHMLIILPSIINLTSGNTDTILPLILSASFAQTGMVLAIWIKTKDRKLKDIAFPAWISGIFGVTEPAIYGVTLPRVKYFIITCVISGIFSALAGAVNLTSYQMAGMGIFGIPGSIAPDGSTSSLIWALIVTFGALVAALIVGLIVYKDEEPASEEANEMLIKQTESVLTPIEGVAKALNTVEDSAFANGLLGQGIAIEPTNGNVYAPFSGTVVSLFPTKHAIGLVSETGCELLIHIGMDTVKLNGEHFESFVSQGDKIAKGDKLISFDIAAIKEAGYSIVTPVIVTNTKDYLDVVAVAENDVKINDEILKVMV
ncbi:beta-glucoside-specific PTS transporter subunit IIABC [Mollicutes bacterium LVI A0039]|nr:beta-glucoside-specific PTS transporter subunit IIABC [Mollicutes bacterium LVI A0039]